MHSAPHGWEGLAIERQRVLAAIRELPPAPVRPCDLAPLLDLDEVVVGALLLGLVATGELVQAP